MTDKTIRFDDVKIVTQAFGDPADEPVLLIMGVMASMLWWPEDFCRQLAATGRFVIRYDNRDTGLSTNYGPCNATYTFDDMADDAARVLTAYGIDKAHVVGMSMGGMIAQIFAIRHPSRIKTLTAISTSPIGTDTSGIPGTTQAYMEHSNSGADVDWSDRAQVIDFILRDTRAIAGNAFPYDRAAALAHIERDYDRAKNFASVTNHFSLPEGEDMTGRLAGVAAPLLVIHGSVDPIFPVEHGQALVDAVSGGKLVRVEGGGHELHPGHWGLMIEAIVSHTKNT